eukprot:361582-Chlamydomonas_euryale.AAC.7
MCPERVGGRDPLVGALRLDHHATCDWIACRSRLMSSSNHYLGRQFPWRHNASSWMDGHAGGMVRRMAMQGGWSGGWPCRGDGQEDGHAGGMVRRMAMQGGRSGGWPCRGDGQEDGHAGGMVRRMAMQGG